MAERRVVDKERPSKKLVSIAQTRLLNTLVWDKEARQDARITENIFVDETPKKVYKALEALDARGEEVTPLSLTQAGAELDFNITPELINTIFNIDPTHSGKLDNILPHLQTQVNKDIIISKLEKLKKQMEDSGDIDASKALKELYEIDEIVLNSDKNDSGLVSFDEWSDLYLEDLEQRKLGRKYTYGDEYLDAYLRKGAYPGAITTVAASTGMGKSTYVLSLIDSLIELNVPCMYISLEMGAVDTYDRLISRRCGITNDSLYNQEEIDGVMEAVMSEKERMRNYRNFYFCEDPDIDLVKLKSLIREFKQKTHNDYAIVAVDLITQLKNFMTASNGVNIATAMEIGMNKLNAIAKEENVHIIGVVQFRRDSDSLKVHSVEDIDKLRPTLNDIKNSAAIAERSRVVLSIFRKKYYSDRYLVPQGLIGEDEVEDIMEVQVLKNSNGQAGSIFKYMFDSNFFRLSPIVDEKQARLDQLAGIEEGMSY